MHAPRHPKLHERTRHQLRRAAPYLSLLALNFWLFAPSYFTATAQLLPFTPKSDKQGPYGWDLHGLYAYALTLGARRENLDIFRISIDFALASVLLIWTARSRASRPLRIACTTLYVALWVLLAYHHAVAHFFERKPALLEDARLLLNLLHFIEDYARYGWPLVALLVLLLSLLAWFTSRSFRALQLMAARWSTRRKLALSLALTLPGLCSLLWYGVRRDDPVWQLTSKRIGYNVRASIAESRRLSALRSAPPDLRYEPFSGIRLERKPDVYLVMLEAYGEILSTWDMTDAYQALMARVQQRLSRAGYHMASAYSASPVHGGTSWFSISTVHTGIQIDRPQAYEALRKVGARIPTFTRFFREQGYLTYSLQPGYKTRTGLNRFDMYNYEIPVDAESIDYHGQSYGWGVIPDQYSLGVFRERFFQPTQRPRFAFYMCVSTHLIWDQVPSYARDWKSLNGGSPELSDFDDSWPPISGTERIATGLRREYFRSVAYEWRLLTEWFEAEAKRGNVILVVGDHQPRLEWDAPGGVTMNTPVHVLSQDAAFIERYRSRGFQPGMYARPENGQPLQHAGLFSLLVTELSRAYAAQGSPRGKYFPKGLPLAGLNR